MLQGLRAASKSIFAKALLGGLAAAFALWGVADVFRGGTDTVVAQVGQELVSDNQYDLQLKNQLRQLSSQAQTEFTMDQLKAMGLDRQVLDQIINRAALDDTGRRLGLVASTDAIRSQIRKNNVFTGPDGAFDPNMFLRALQDSGLTEEGYVAATAKDIARAQLVNAAVGGIVPPPGLARLLYNYVTEQRTVEYIVVTPEEAGQVPTPTQADLEAFHTSHSQQFSAPEYRSFDYVELGPNEVAKDVKVADDELKAEYDAHSADYEKAEQREIEQIVFPSKDEADKAAARIKTPADFATVAKERGLKDADLKLGTFTKAQMDQRLADAAFSLPKGAVSQPLQGAFGWVILHAANIVPGEHKTFEDVKEQIRETLVKSKSVGMIADLANKFEDARGGGANLADAAQKLGLPLRHVASADREGNTPEGGKAEIPAQPEFMAQVFQTESGEESDLFATADGVNFAVHVTMVTPPSVKPFASVREDVRTAFLAEARTKLLQTKVDAFTEQAKKENSLAGVGKTLKHAPLTSMPLRRNQTDDVFSADVLGKLFAATDGSVVSGPAGRGNGFVIARVIKTEHFDPDATAADYVQYRRTASEQLVDTAIESLASAARDSAGVSIHQQTVQRVLGETPQ